LTGQYRPIGAYLERFGGGTADPGGKGQTDDGREQR
jgi:hypothetical protein